MMEITIANLIFVAAVLIVIYYIGYVSGYTKSTIVNNSIIGEKKSYIYNIDGYDIELDRKMSIRNAKVEKNGESLYIYDADTNVFLGTGTDLFSVKEMIVKYLTEAKLYDVMYTVRKEDREMLINHYYTSKIIDEQKSV